ncbi:MAG: branched-chain amino acid transaminase [Deltaproteobacteria bacterium]|jgi:branched-chain amino acid aminotransferase
MVEKAKFIWFDGKMIPWDQAQVHVLTHTLHYGLGVFEGIRAYQCADGRTAIFRLKEHTRRLFDSAHVMLIDIPFTPDDVNAACCELLRVNEQKEAYIRPLVFLGEGVMGLNPQGSPVQVAIISWIWGAYLGDEGLRQGIRVKTSSFIRHHVNIMMTKTKTVGNYVNSIMAKLEAVQAGCDEALLLDTEGYICEASGENIFIVKDGALKTPPLTSILPGITRNCVITIAEDLGLRLKEERFSRDELYLADEAFFTGTAAEVTPIREVDNRIIGPGQPGPVTRQIQEAYFGAVKGQNVRYEQWLTYI